MTILVVTEYYLPGYKAGGPVRTIASLVSRLGDEFDFRILTLDRDLKAQSPYPDVKPSRWHVVGKAHVMYLPPAEKRLWRWCRWLRCLKYDVMYLNGCFSRSTIRTLVLRRLGLVPDRPVILAPRGEFSAGALGLKTAKKKLYLTVSRRLNLYRDLTWQASSDYERQDIIKTLGDRDARVMVAPNLVEEKPTMQSSAVEKTSGSLRLAFLSRIAPMKNLDYALRILHSVQGSVLFDVYGPLEDDAYWRTCQSIVAELPSDIQVAYRGEVSPDRVETVLAGYHLLLLPTRGENFGHVISEALRAGCPVLISDQTPWQQLEPNKAGWVIPLSQPERFGEVLNTIVEMDNETFQQWAEGARAYGEQAAGNPSSIQANRDLFADALLRKRA